MSNNPFKMPKPISDPTKPHTAMIIVYYSTHQKDDQNRVSGTPVEYEHKQFYINAEDKSICDRKVGELLEMIGGLCSKEPK